MTSERTCQNEQIRTAIFNNTEANMHTMGQNETFITISEGDDANAGGDNTQNNPNLPSSQKRAKKRYCIPQIAIQKSTNETEQVILFNGIWDTSETIPVIVAEMHNVKLDWLGENDSFNLNPNDCLNEEKFTVPSPKGSDSGLGNDSPDGNLSWLLNFKVDDIPGLGENCTQTSRNYQPRRPTDLKNSPVFTAEPAKQYFDHQQQQQNVNANVQRIIREQQNATFKENSSKPTSKASAPANRCTNNTGLRKPPFTYTELIEHALREKGELTVSGIYQWISDHFSFYKANDDRWKNSVRHNLSINPHFRKGSKAIHGAGHLWTIAEKDDIRTNSQWNLKRQKMQKFMQTQANHWHQEQQQELELAAATASILPETDSYDCSQYVLMKSEDSAPMLLQQSADEILGGLKREVEVQYVIPIASNTMDFMCPVSKEQVAQECGLTGQEIQLESDYLITDLNPNTLGLNLTEAEIITQEQLFSEEINFQCYEIHNELCSEQ